MNAKQNSVLLKAVETEFGIDKAAEVISVSELDRVQLTSLMDYQFKLDKNHGLKLSNKVLVKGLANLLFNLPQPE